MFDRKRQIEELLIDLASLKRIVATQQTGSKETMQITPSQWGALLFIELQRTTSVKEVAKALTISSSAATQLIDGLVKNDFVVRQTQQDDRRSVSLRLSKVMQSKVARMKQAKVEKFLLLFKSLSDDEFTLYCALNKKIIAATKRKKSTTHK